MDDQIIKENLYNKMKDEYEKYINNLKQLAPEEIIAKSYETTMKDETVAMFYPENEKFNIEDLQNLLKLDKPLDELYDGWLDCDLNLNELFEDSVRNTMEYITEHEHQKQIKKKCLER